MNKFLNTFIRILFVCIFLCFLMSNCKPGEDKPYFPISTPEEQGMDSQTLLMMLDYIESSLSNIHSLLIIRNGKTVMEVYYPPFGSQDKHMLFSATKSFVSALVGIAVNEGKIQNVDQPVLDFFPNTTIENLDDRKKNIHIHDLLNMTSGLTANDDQMGESQDWSQFTLNQPMNAEPGTIFDYNSGNSHLLSAIIQKTTGKTTFEYAKEKLFDSLEIQNVYWAADPSGVSQGGVGLMLTPRDMAKFGYLYLNQGKWNGKQIVPAEWIETSIQTNENGYAYQWWQRPKGYAALGYAGQFISVAPSLNLVLVCTSALSDAQMVGTMELIETSIILAIDSEQSLPKNPVTGQLSDQIKAIASPSPKEIPDLPAMAGSINGKTFKLDENPFGWKTARLDFKDNQAWLLVTSNTFPQEQKFEIGMDGVYRKTVQKRSSDKSFIELEQRKFLNPYEFNFLLGMPWDGSVAMKGDWIGEDKFTITVQDTRDFDRERLSFKYTPPAGMFAWNSEIGGFYLNLTGTYK
jgi:CubicO group peptidase (beta-lactamase class C family)